MGYRSDVALALTKAGVIKLNEEIHDRKTSRMIRSKIELLLGTAEKHHIAQNGAEVWYWEDKKWYIGDPRYYPDVDFIDTFLGKLDNDDFRFIRIGEDYDDTEVYGNFWENPFGLELVRGISFSDPS